MSNPPKTKRKQIKIQNNGDQTIKHNTTNQPQLKHKHQQYLKTNITTTQAVNSLN